MTYQAFADLLTQYGYKFEDVMNGLNGGKQVDWGVESTGFG